MLNGYDGKAINMVMTTVVSEELQEPLAYEKVLVSLEVELRK